MTDGHGNRSSVLIIDDEYGARLQVELALQMSTLVQVAATANNGMQGAELAERLQPDVIVLDLSMPVMDGMEALPLLRKVAPAAVVLVRSNHDDDTSVDAALALGASRFIPKFLEPVSLREIIESAARGPGVEQRRRFVAGLRRPTQMPEFAQ